MNVGPVIGNDWAPALCSALTASRAWLYKFSGSQLARAWAAWASLRSWGRDTTAALPSSLLQHKSH